MVASGGRAWLLSYWIQNRGAALLAGLVTVGRQRGRENKRALFRPSFNLSAIAQ